MRRAPLFLDTWPMLAAHMTGRRQTIMALYLNKSGYTAEAWQRLLASPEDRREVLAAMAEAARANCLGSSVHSATMTDIRSSRRRKMWPPSACC